MGTLWQDLRFAVRTLRGSPSFTAVAVLTMALGIGANTALFSIVNGVLLNPLPYPRPDQLVALWDWDKGRDQEINATYPNFLDWQRENRTFAFMAALRHDDFNLIGVGETQRLPGEMVSATFFPSLGVKPMIGRVFRAEEDRPGAEPVVLISAGLWERRFASSPDILGTAITLSGARYTVVGVVPAGLRCDRPNDVYVPLGQSVDRRLRDRRAHTVQVLGRLKSEASLAQARADMDQIVRDLAREYPEENRGDMSVVLVPLKKDIVGDVQSFLLILRCRGFCLAYRVCQCGKSSLSALGWQKPRVRCSSRTWRQPPADSAATPDRKRLACSLRRRARFARRGVGNPGGAERAPRSLAARGRSWG